MVYLIGSLRNPEIPRIAGEMRAKGLEVFDDWFAAGPEADDKWREYEIGRGRSYTEALGGLAAEHVFQFDLEHLRRCEAGVLVLPAGKSGHMELGYLLGAGKPGYILLDKPDRWDVMYKFATKITTELEEIIEDVSRRLKAANDYISLLEGAVKSVTNPIEVGSTISFASNVGGKLVEGPFNESRRGIDWSYTHSPERGFQRFPKGDAGR